MKSLLSLSTVSLVTDEILDGRERSPLWANSSSITLTRGQKPQQKGFPHKLSILMAWVILNDLYKLDYLLKRIARLNLFQHLTRNPNLISISFL